MTDLLKLAEQYYAVAASLTATAKEHLYIAERLNSIADQLCEANMRVKVNPDDERRETPAMTEHTETSVPLT